MEARNQDANSDHLKKCLSGIYSLGISRDSRHMLDSSGHRRASFIFWFFTI